MSYIVSHKTTTPVEPSTMRFKRIAVIDYPPHDVLHGIPPVDADRYVKAVAITAAGQIGVREGEFLVSYGRNGEWSALVRVSQPEPAYVAEVL